MALDEIKSEYRREFYRKYHAEIVPLFSGLETERKQYLSKVWIIETITALVLVLTLYVSIKSQCYVFAGAISVLCVSVLSMAPMKFNKLFVTEVKKYCMRPILDIFGKISWKNDTITTDDLKESELFGYFNRRTNDDGFVGEYKGVQFAISETELVYETGSGKNRRRVPVFKGVVIKFASNKTIWNKTIISTKGDRNIKQSGVLSAILIIVPLLINVLSVLKGKMAIAAIIAALVVVGVIVLVLPFCSSKKEKLNKINLEDPVFARKFNAYSSDEIEGRYLITTAFMERFINMNTAFGAKQAKCSFYRDSIMFAISTNKNLFEMGNLFAGAGEPKHMTTFFEEFASILMLVDYFKLHEHTKL